MAAKPFEIVFAKGRQQVVLTRLSHPREMYGYLEKRLHLIQRSSARKGEKILIRDSRTGKTVDVTREMWRWIRKALPLCR